MNRLAVLLLAANLHAAPTVTKVDPPNWWTGHSINPVRLLIRGTGLAGARVEATDTGVTVGPPRVNSNGTYLFVDVTIKGAGQHPLKITTADGSVTAPFEVLAPLPRPGRFQGFSQDDLIYLIMPDRFANGDRSNDDPPISKGLFDPSKPRYYHGGDLQGVIDHLPYLKELGVTAVWINPVYDNVNHLNEKEKYDNQPIADYHGYGAVDFYGVDEHLGDLPKFRELTEAAHRSGMKLILDMVANHTGPYHPWVEDPPTATWFHGTAAQHPTETWQTWTLISSHAPQALQASTLDGWFIDILPDLNQDDPETANYLIQNTLWWVGRSGLDGIRQDTLPYVPRRFWRDWMAAIKKEYPNLRVVGEMFDGDPVAVSFFQGGRAQFDGVDSGVDSLFDFPQFWPIRRAFGQGQTIKEVATMLGRDYLYPNPNNLVTFLGLHDVQRFMNEPGATAEGLKLAFTYLMTSRGIPMIYYGDEIAMRGGNDPDNRRDFPWSDRTAEQQTVFEHVRKLGQLRAQNADLRQGDILQLAAGDNTYAYRRGSTIVLFNNGGKPETIEVEAVAGSWHDLLGGVADLTVADGKLRVAMQPRRSAILQLQSSETTQFRPEYHFSPAKNWTNDPNGLVFYQGEYHLFYQYNPFGNQWGHMSWGHAVSPDMAHWQHLPVALPEENGIMIFSGSAVVDRNNSSGLCTGVDCLVAIYTGHTSTKQTQDIAFSNDRGRTWTKYKGNPVIDLGMKDFRDPKVFWHEPDRRWIMVVALPKERKVRFFASRDLKQWTALSDFGPAGATGGDWECPDLFPLKFEGGQRWMLSVNINPGGLQGGSANQYFVGQFDGTKFTNDNPASKVLWADYGKDFYASTSFSDIPDPDGRRIWIGWFSNWLYAKEEPTSPWRCMQSIPRVLKLAKMQDGIRLVQEPIAELQTLRGEAIHVSNATVAAANERLRDFHSDSYELVAEFEPGSSVEFGFKVRKGVSEETLVAWNGREVFVDRRKSGNVTFHKDFPGKHGSPLTKPKLHIFVDRSSIEIFGGDGEAVISERIFPSPASGGLEVYSSNGDGKVLSLDVWKLRR